MLIFGGAEAKTFEQIIETTVEWLFDNSSNVWNYELQQACNTTYLQTYHY
jgi:hypothetical protein